MYRGLDRDRGIQHDAFKDVLKKVSADSNADGIPETMGTDRLDPRGLSVKPSNDKAWDHPPMNEEEEAIYYGSHIHSESNPLGLHSHVKGGKPSGAHSHGPQNRTGVHHHKEQEISYFTSLDGEHLHEGNFPDGKHCHCPENFG